MKRLITLVALAVHLVLPLAAQEVGSPDGAIAVKLSLAEGAPVYEVTRQGRPVLEASPLGLETSLGSLATGLTAAGFETRRLDERYTLPHGKVRDVHYVANELTARFANAQGLSLEVIFRVSDRDVAFAYRVFAKDQQRLIVQRERTGFKFPATATAFVTHQAKAGDGWMATKPSYEEGYLLDVPVGTPSPSGLGFTFPALFRLGADGWALVSETGVSSHYAGTRLGDPSPAGLYPIAFPEPGENAGIGETTVAAALPLLTPWRTLTLGVTLAPIVETTVSTDVVAPLYAPSEVYRPGRATWSWLLWQDASMNEADQRTFIDLAATMGYDYILIDALWDVNLGRAKLAELVAYARAKQVGVLLWYNSNGAWNDAPQTPRHALDSAPARQREMAWLKSIGVKGLKVDFFGGDKQVTMKLYEDLLTDANAHGLMLNFHGATLPRGWERMYPNFMTSEAVTASENLVFSQGFADGEAQRSTVISFVRNPVAAMDYGPMVLNRTFHREAGKGNQRRTTDAFQLATTVIYQSPLQHFGLTPNNLTEQPAFVLDFLKGVPAAWDETRYVAGYPGRDIALARRSGDRWYLAATNGEPQRKELTFCVPLLQGRTFTLIHDGPAGTAATRPVTVGADGQLTLTLEPGGGAVLFTPDAPATAPAAAVTPDTPVTLYPLEAVRLLNAGPFYPAVQANRAYVLALAPDRLLAPFRREAGLPAVAQPYGNWESGGLDGHTAGHYLSALANMIASGEDTADGQLRQRLDHVLGELQACQQAYGDGYIGGVPGSRALWTALAAGDLAAINRKWVPWYNVHKTFAGLRDVYRETGDIRARDLLVGLGNWCVTLVSGLSDEQMQRMLDQEHGGMNEVLADLYALTGDRRYLATAERFNHRAVLDPLIRQEDRLTGKHANTQIPKVIGLERLATLTGNSSADAGARFFWDTVTRHRSVAFGGNSVSEHFNDPHDFRGLLLHREGPETCNTYNLLRLTEQLFASGPNAAYADYYERALYNHILASLHPTHPGYVYFTPIRPDHYRVYSQPDQGFWCCVGTGMENPGKYGQFIYARARDGLYVNLFIASELRDSTLGLTLRQETVFPDEERTRLTLRLAQPQTLTLYLRQPGWVAPGAFAVTVNGTPVAVTTAPSAYVAVRREWRDGDRVELALPMRTTVEGLPDGSPWSAILRGPIVLAHPAGTRELTGLRADDSRMAHVAAGPEVPLDQVPVLLTEPAKIPAHVVADPAAGPLHFRLVDVVEPAPKDGLTLIPFFRLHDARYQMYWESTTREGIAARQAQLAAAERARAAREAATLDQVSPGEQQPEVEHAYQGEDTESGLYNGRHWRHGRRFQYTLNARGATAATLSITYSGSDTGRQFDIFANDTLVATQDLVGEKTGEFVEKHYPLPASVLAAAADGRVTIRFVAKKILAGGVFDVRLLRADVAK